MANSSSNIQQIAASANLPSRVNENFDAFSPASFGGRRASAVTGLTWGYYAGKALINGLSTNVADGTVAATASTTRYVEMTRTGTVVISATRTPGNAPLYILVAGASSITSYTDERTPAAAVRISWGRHTLAMANANQTLTQEQALCESLTLTGALTALRDVIVPNEQRPYWIFANVTGGFGVRVKTSAGAGVTVADGRRALVECDGTDVVRWTADL